MAPTHKEKGSKKGFFFVSFPTKPIHEKGFCLKSLLDEE